MQLAYNLITNNNNPINTDYIRKFKSLDLIGYTKKYNSNDYYSLINNKKNIKIAKNLFFNIINSKDNLNKDEISHNILKAYYITYYSDDIFVGGISNIENELLYSAKYTVSSIEDIVHTKKKFQCKKTKDSLSNILDYYLSVYNIWISQDRISYIEGIFENIKEKYQISQYLRISEKYIDDINHQITNMYLINPYFSASILLDNYEILRISSQLYSNLWDVLKASSIDFNRIFLIIISALRIKLINLINIAEDRKDLYYKIDTDELVNKMRTEDFSTRDIEYVISIFVKKINIISPKFKINIDVTDNNLIIDLFCKMFNEIYT